MPDTLSWAFLNASKRHYDQGGCGSCWAIASAVLLEAHSEIHSAEGKSRTFSAQELVSCVPNPKHCGGTGGCEGATIELAMDWVIKHGLADDVAVPYMGQDGECLADKQPEGASLLQIREHASTRSSTMPLEETIGGAVASSMPGSKFGMKSWERLPENEYPALLRALQDGPVGISVAGSNWFDYSSGIFDSCTKDTIIDHAVVLIGYGKEDGGDGYWLIKNSWGPEWGENGLMRLMRRNGEEEGKWCGVDRQPQLGSGCDGGPSEVKVCGTCGILYDTVVPHWTGSAEKAKEHATASEKY
jgi:cathepsin L